jgi:hypothetical protein
MLSLSSATAESRLSNNAASTNEENPVLGGPAPCFAAMEYYALILNRTYKMFVTDRMLCGAKVRGLVANPRVVPPQMFDQAFWIRTPAAQIYDSMDVTSEKLLRANSANFQIRWDEIVRTEYLPDKKWGMGNVPYSGRLVFQTRTGRPRELILLGKQNGSALKQEFDRLVKDGS